MHALDAPGELAGDVPLGQHEAAGHQALHRARAGGDDAPSPEFLHQRLRHREGVGGGQCHRQQPGQQLAPMAGPEHAEAERRAQSVELLAPGLRPGGVGGERVRADMELGGDEAERRLEDGLAWA